MIGGGRMRICEVGARVVVFGSNGGVEVDSMGCDIWAAEGVGQRY